MKAAITIAQRLKVLEVRLAALEKRRSKAKKPWLKPAGWAKDDPIYDEAMRLGAEYRKSS